MKSRIVILSMLVLGMLLSTAGAGLAVSGLAGQDNASIAQYGERRTPTGGGDVLGDEDSGNNVLPEDNNGGGDTSPGAATPSSPPARSRPAPPPTRSLPFTGFAAVPVLLGGIALLSAGLVLRRRTGEQR